MSVAPNKMKRGPMAWKRTRSERERREGYMSATRPKRQMKVAPPSGRRPAGEARPGTYQEMYEQQTGGVPWDTKTMQGKSRTPGMEQTMRQMMSKFLRGGR